MQKEESLKKLQVILRLETVDRVKEALSSIGIGGAIALGSRWAVLDPIAAVVVSLLIVWQAVGQVRQAAGELLEQSLPGSAEDRIRSIVLQEPGVSDVHHLRTRRIGSSVAMEMHLRMDGRTPLAEAHAHATAIERRLRREFGPRTLITLHMEPLKPAQGQPGC